MKTETSLPLKYSERHRKIKAGDQYTFTAHITNAAVKFGRVKIVLLNPTPTELADQRLRCRIPNPVNPVNSVNS